MRPYFWRDIRAALAGMTPDNGWSWPSTVDGRVRTRQLDVAQELLRDEGYAEWAEVIFEDPMTTAVALAAKLRHDADEDPLDDRTAMNRYVTEEEVEAYRPDASRALQSHLIRRFPEYFDPSYEGERPPVRSFRELVAELDDDEGTP